MARDFTKNLANRLTLPTGLIATSLSGVPAISVHAWVYIRSVSSNSVSDNAVFNSIVNGTTSSLRLAFDGTSGNPRIRATGRPRNSGAGVVTGASNVPMNQWASVGAVFNFAGDRNTAYLNGSADASATFAYADTSYATGIPTDNDSIGHSAPSIDQVNYHLDGLIAELALWDGDIGVDAFGELYAGRIPSAVRPSIIRHYWPLVGIDPVTEPDLVGRVNGTIAGFVPIADHPRIFT
jgi:hypothetical protein